MNPPMRGTVAGYNLSTLFYAALSVMEGMYWLFLLFGVMLFASVLASRISARFGMPLLLLFIMLGMLAGEEGLLGIRFNDVDLAMKIGNGALAIILLDGGLRTEASTLYVAGRPAAVLASWGVIATTLVLGLFATWLFSVDWQIAMLLAAIVGSTDAAAVFSLLRSSGVRLNERVQSTLEIESGANDPMAMILVLALIEVCQNRGDGDGWGYVLMAFRQIGVGTVLGLLGGLWLSKMLKRLRLAEGLYAMLVVSGGLMVYAFTSLLQGSGILAVYLAGIVIGNRRSHAIEHVLHVMDGLAWLSQAGMFVVLGLLVNPTMLAVHPVESLLLALFLMLVARPLAVFSSLWFFRFTWREMLYISWVGLRGAVPVVLAMYPMVMGVERGAAMLLFTVAFTVVVLSLLLQGSTIARVARWLDMVVPPKPGPLDRREIWMNRKTALELVQYQVGANARAVDHYPEAFVRQETGDGVYFAAALRGDKMLGRTQKLQAGDYIWLFTPESAIASLTPAFAANDAEELAQSAAFFGEFTLEASHVVDSVADVYGLQLEEDERGMTLAAFFVRRLGRPPVEGDRISVGAFEMTARAVERGQVARVGLKFSDH